LSFIAQSAVSKVNDYTSSSKKATDIHWVITVPAIWSAAASKFMRRAALKAGLIKFQLSEMLTLVSESEALWADLLGVIEQCNNLNLEVGDELLVVEGGVATSTTSFVKVISENPLRCQETRPSAGGAVGAGSIDIHFRKLLEDLFGKSRYDTMKGTTEMIDVIDHWEQFKVSFEGEHNYTCDLRRLIDDYHELLPSANIIDNAAFASLVAAYNEAYPQDDITARTRRIVIPATLLARWFDSVVDRVIGDLHRHVAPAQGRAVRIVYMAGGLFNNRYCNGRITNFLNTNHPTTAVITAKYSEVAVVRGAALAAMRPGCIVDGHVFASTGQFSYDALVLPASLHAVVRSFTYCLVCRVERTFLAHHLCCGGGRRRERPCLRAAAATGVCG
jgi:hypothetical protein